MQTRLKPLEEMIHMVVLRCDGRRLGRSSVVVLHCGDLEPHTTEEESMKPIVARRALVVNALVASRYMGLGRLRKRILAFPSENRGRSCRGVRSRWETLMINAIFDVMCRITAMSGWIGVVLIIAALRIAIEAEVEMVLRSVAQRHGLGRLRWGPTD